MTKRRLQSLAAPIAVGALLMLSAAPAQAAFPGRDGVTVFYASFIEGEGQPDGIYTATTVGGYQQRFITAGYQPRFNPYGKRIAYQDVSGAIYTVRVGGTGKQLIYRPVSGSLASIPFWSPKHTPGGERLGFVVTPQTGVDSRKGDIWTVPTSDGKPIGPATRLTYIGAKKCGVVTADWSPDGTHVVYGVQYSGRYGVCESNGELIVRNLSRNTWVVVPPFRNAAGYSWPPIQARYTADGTTLAINLKTTDNCNFDDLRYNIAAQTYTDLGSSSQCIGAASDGTAKVEIAPTPSGGEAYLTNSQNGTHFCLISPNASKCATVESWGNIDVQPVAPGGT